jgi:hypothetical protein
VFDVVNSGIWQFHQHTESLKTAVLLLSEMQVSVGNAIVERADDGWGSADICKVIRWLDFVPDPLDRLTYFLSDCGAELPDPQAKDLETYRAFPIASPFPSIAKFKADIPCSFLWRLDAWYLVNPAVYVNDNPTDTGDETDGEDEYPVPDSVPDSEDFPPSSAPQDGADTRDYGDGFGGGNGTAENPYVASAELYFCSRNRLDVTAGASPSCQSKTAVVGWPGQLLLDVISPSQNEVYYVWSGGRVLLTNTGFPPVEISQFSVTVGGEAVFSLPTQNV